jgi:hypothetical protein
MKIRTTERKHSFTEILFGELNVFSLESLTMDENNNFTSCLEGIEYDNDEMIDLSIVFSHNQLHSKLYLSKLLNLPLYFMVYQSSRFFIFQVFEVNGSVEFKLKENFNEEEFVLWWRKLKGHKQNKPFHEPNRINHSIFDIVIEKRGFSWGGNIDGFMFKRKKIVCIIENIYTQKNPLNSEKGDPRTYFKTKGPNYNSWKPIVLLSRMLNVPLFLITWDGKSNQEQVGFSVIDKLSPDDIVYRGNPPYKNVIRGKDLIIETIFENLFQVPPDFI